MQGADAGLQMNDGFYSQAIHQAGLCKALEPLLTPQTPQAPLEPPNSRARDEASLRKRED